MGCYGIGPSRVMGVIVEKCHDDDGIIWPSNIAPFTAVIIAIGEKGLEKAKEMYQTLVAAGMEVCLDDRDL